MKLNTKSIRRFVHKELKWNVDFYSIEEYLQRQGYIVIFYNTESGDNILKNCGLSEYAKPIHAFTYKDDRIKIVFIDMKLSTANKLYSLLHETAHIYLNHIDRDPAISDKRLQEMEADTFAHQALEYAKSYDVLKSGIKLSIPAIILSVICLFGTFQLKPIAKTTIVPTEDMSEARTGYKTEVTETTYVLDSKTACVYITPFGTKFHRPNCRYVKNKSCAAFLRTEATKNYSPCLVCNP